MKSEEAKTRGEMAVPGQTTGTEEAAEHTDVSLMVSALNSTPHGKERTLSRDWTRQ